MRWLACRSAFAGLTILLSAASTRDIRGAGEQSGRMGLEGLSWQSAETMHDTERAVVMAIRRPLLAGKDCSEALASWFAGREADAKGDKERAIAAWKQAVNQLDGLSDLPLPPPANPVCGPLAPVTRIEGSTVYLVLSYVVKWTLEEQDQFGLLLVPKQTPKGHRFPLLTYIHDGTSGLPGATMKWLSKQCRRGYVVFIPSLPGQAVIEASKKLAQIAESRTPGDVNDLRAAALHVRTGVAACLHLPVVRHEDTALLGVGRGGTIALLAATSASCVACVIAVDAERLNPFRLYWECMARGDRRWADWAQFCNREPKDQLLTMMGESVVHQAGRIACPVLMILPESERDSVRGDMCREVQHALPNAGDRATLDVIEGRVRSFVTAWQDGPGFTTYRHIVKFLYAHCPPDDGLDVLLEEKKASGGGRR